MKEPRIFAVGAFLLALASGMGACGAEPRALDIREADPGLNGGGFDGDASRESFELEVQPPNPIVPAAGTSVSQVFHAYRSDTHAEVPVSWSLDIGTLGTISVRTGEFVANGAVGGVAKVTATYGRQTASTLVTVNVSIVDTNGVSAADQASLRAGGPLAADPGFRWLYPYDKTVFPRGIRAPILQFGGAAPAAARITFASKHFTYETFFGSADAARAPIDEARWKAMTMSASGSDVVRVSASKKTGGVIVGPIEETWTIAPANLQGTVYYSTYRTALADGNAALLKLRPGSTNGPEVLQGGCAVCHNVSANGSVVATGFDWAEPDPASSGILTIDKDGKATKRRTEPKGAYAFAALTPDAKYMMTHSNAAGGVHGLTAASGAYSVLRDPHTGTKVSGVKGWPDTMQAQMPSFSPDGKFLVFNDRSTDSTGKTLTAMGFDQAALAFTPLGSWRSERLVAWPAFLPDSKAVVFHAGTGFGTEGGTVADIELVDASQKHSLLPALNGYQGTDTVLGPTYLPYGEANEGHLNYEPTVLPVASGGYFWVVFTSRRAYGNLIDDKVDPWALVPTAADPSRRKKLWVAAIDIHPTPGVDRSHPAFYLPNQELETGNMRGFWALDPCRPDGASCDTGDMCCGGYCRQVEGPRGTTAFQCADKSAGCGREGDKCQTSSECCAGASGVQCINGHCAALGPK